MRRVRSMFLGLSLWCVLAGAPQVMAAADGQGDATSQSTLSSAQLQALADRLEDEGQRKQLVETLRTLAEVDKAEKDQQNGVKSAAADALAAVAERVSGATGAVATLLGHLRDLPGTLAGWAMALRDPQVREHWFGIIGRLLAVLGIGFAAGALLSWPIRRARRRREGGQQYGLPGRILRLLGLMVVDMLPVIVFAAASYGALAALGIRHETRLVAVALINASILSRLVLALSGFLFAPDTPSLRLWRMGDETAQYLHHWVKRLTLIAIYGFFILQAALLLGLKGDLYALALHLLAAVILGLLLVLIAQNRHEVAQVIAAEPPADAPSSGGLAPLRRGLARIWHLAAGFYLVVVFGIWALQVKDGAAFLVRATLITLVVIAVTLLVFRAIDRLFDRGLRLSDDLRERLPGLERRLNLYFPILHRALKAVGLGIATLLIADAWGIDALHWLIDGPGKALVSAAVNILVIVAVAVLIWEVASGSIERYLAGGDPDTGEARSPRIRTLLTVGRNALMVLLTVVASLMVLSELGINIAPLLAGAGVVGLAIGFGAQRLVQDVITGVFILFQDLMAVGDVVKLGDYVGVVEALSIRTVRLRDVAGVVHTVPFSTIEGVSNLTREFSFHVFELGIAYREDVDAVIELIKQIGGELRELPEVGDLVLEPLEVFGLDQFGDSAIVIKGRIKTRPGKQWSVGRAFNRLVKQRFDEAGVEIPVPHQTIYFGQDRDGKAPPAFLQVEALLNHAADGPRG